MKKLPLKNQSKQLRECGKQRLAHYWGIIPIIGFENNSTGRIAFGDLNRIHFQPFRLQEKVHGSFFGLQFQPYETVFQIPA
jgi:hypothetical protein